MILFFNQLMGVGQNGKVSLNAALPAAEDSKQVLEPVTIQPQLMAVTIVGEHRQGLKLVTQDHVQVNFTSKRFFIDFFSIKDR